MKSKSPAAVATAAPFQMPNLDGFDAEEFLGLTTTKPARIWNVVIGFDLGTSSRAAKTLVSGFTSEAALDRALAVSSDHAKGQDDTVGNVRSRATAVLSSAIVAVTLATTLGLFASKDNPSAAPLTDTAAWILFGISLSMLALMISVQWPHTWTFDAGTNYLRGVGSKVECQARELVMLEIGIDRNTRQLSRVFFALNLMFVLLAGAAVVVLLTLLGRIP